MFRDELCAGQFYTGSAVVEQQMRNRQLASHDDMARQRVKDWAGKAAKSVRRLTRPGRGRED